MRFEDPITTIDELREVVSPPPDLVSDKEIDHLDHHCRSFIERSPFVIVASTDGAGSVDLSPKGDPPGFVRVVDDHTLAIPERPGNHRADTFLNVLQHPHVGLIFLIPGTRNTLRVRGRATIVRDRGLRESMTVDGPGGPKVPDLALVVEVTMAMFHCAKCIIRSDLWGAAAGGEAMPEHFLAQTMVDHGDLDLPVEKMHRIITADEERNLY